MSFEQKKLYMQQVVMPRMAHVFQAYSRRRYSNFGCATCHGPSPSGDSFRMPNPALRMTAGDVQAALNPGAEPIAAFMVHDVDPAMAKLLGLSVSPPGRPQAYGCFRCHTLEQ